MSTSETKHNGMTKEEFANWLFDLHTEPTKERNTPEALMLAYYNECENHDEGLALCEVRSRESATGNPYDFTLPEAWFE